MAESTKILETETAKSGWLCIPCFEGILVIPESEYGLRQLPNETSVGVIQFLPDTSEVSSEELDGKGKFIPGRPSDRVFLDEPSLPTYLVDEEINDLTAPRQDFKQLEAVAATFYGPETQEKKSNEDYALSAIINDHRGDHWAFAAVADGVSTRTFWSARTARIACLTAFSVVRNLILSDRVSDDDGLAGLRENLVEALQHRLNRDKEALLRQKHVIPPTFSPDSYHAFIGRNELWYNSTLLTAALGPKSGFIMWAGDGGIMLVKTNGGDQAQEEGRIEKKVVLTSTEDLSIGTFVSLGVSTKDFSLARISYDERISRVDVYLSSDGVDRTLQLNADMWSYESLQLTDDASARKQLELLSKLEKRDNDNFSIARLSRRLDNRVEHDGPGLFAGDQPPGNQILGKPTEEPDSVPNSVPILIDKQEQREKRALKDGVNAPEGPNAKLTKEADSDLGRTVSTPVFVSGLLAALLIGVVIGLLGMRTYDARSANLRNPHVITVRPDGGSNNAAPSSSEQTETAPEPAPLILDDSTQKALRNGPITRELSAVLDGWLSYLKQHSAKRFSVVAYADRASPDDMKDCKTNAAVSKQRAEAVINELRRRAKQEGFSVNINASQRVCEAPAGVSDIKDRASRRLVLIEGITNDCTCDKK